MNERPLFTCIHERSDWPGFRWDDAALAPALTAIKARHAALLTAMAGLGFDARQEKTLSVIVSDVVASSEIEGEILYRAQVRSSVARRLGMDVAGLPHPTRGVEGVVEMSLDATQRFAEPLTPGRLFAWHTAMFPTGYGETTDIRVGTWRDDRDGPMRVVSGRIDRETVHFKAPPAARVADEMARFLDWFEREPLDPVLKAGIAHLWFVTIHSFDDGNGRIGRAILDLALSRYDDTSQRFYSMSKEIFADRKEYYKVLERTQKASMDVTQWLQWFLVRLGEALRKSEDVVALVRTKTEFWTTHTGADLNDRQRKVLNRLLDGFDGKLRTGKYAALAKCSSDTALRDLADLVQKGVLVRDETAGGRSTSYRIQG